MQNSMLVDTAGQLLLSCTYLLEVQVVGPMLVVLHRIFVR
jgi:hypothetical protein